MAIRFEGELWDSMARLIYIHTALTIMNWSTYQTQDETQPRGNANTEFLSTLVIFEMATLFVKENLRYLILSCFYKKMYYVHKLPDNL